MMTKQVAKPHAPRYLMIPKCRLPAGRHNKLGDIYKPFQRDNCAPCGHCMGTRLPMETITSQGHKKCAKTHFIVVILFYRGILISPLTYDTSLYPDQSEAYGE
jgi:hypothetical protein